jgi:hypothetical protein
MRRTIIIAALATVAVLASPIAGRNARANHVSAPDEISIYGTATAPVGSNLVLNLAVTTSTTPHLAVQFSLRYGDMLSYAAAGASATYACNVPGAIDYPSLFSGGPSEQPPAAGFRELRNGFCIATAAGYPGAVMTGQFVSVPLRCLSAGTTYVAMLPLDGDGNGTSLFKHDASVGSVPITTTLEDSISTPSGPQPAWAVSCLPPDNDALGGPFGGTQAWIADGTAVAEAAHTGVDSVDANDDNDLMCTDTEETGGNINLGGARNPLNPWDFADVPTPSLPMAGAARSGSVSLSDVGAALPWIGRTNNGPPAGGRDYDDDVNANGVEDGAEYDRTPAGAVSGPPDGAISLQDVGVILTQVGDSCMAAPN